MDEKLKCIVAYCSNKKNDGDRLFCINHRSDWKVECTITFGSSADVPEELIAQLLSVFADKVRIK